MRFGLLHRLRAKCVSFAVLATLVTAHAGAADQESVNPKSPKDQTVFRALDIPAKQLVELVGAEHGFKVNTSARVRGSVTKMNISGSREEMLKAVSAQVPIDWFTHSGILYVSSPDEEMVQFLPLKSLTLASVEELLEQSGLDYSRHSVEPLKNEAAIKVVGPPMMVEIIEAIVQLSSVSENLPTKAPSVLVRRGLQESREYFGANAPTTHAPQPVPAQAGNTQAQGTQTDES